MTRRRETVIVHENDDSQGSEGTRQSDSACKIGQGNIRESEESPEEEGPKRIGEPFDMFARIKDEALAGRKVERVAKADVGVVGDVRPEIQLDSQRHQSREEQCKKRMQ